MKQILFLMCSRLSLFQPDLKFCFSKACCIALQKLLSETKCKITSASSCHVASPLVYMCENYWYIQGCLPKLYACLSQSQSPHLQHLVQMFSHSYRAGHPHLLTLAASVALL